MCLSQCWKNLARKGLRAHPQDFQTLAPAPARARKIFKPLAPAPARARNNFSRPPRAPAGLFFKAPAGARAGAGANFFEVFPREKEIFRSFFQ